MIRMIPTLLSTTHTFVLMRYELFFIGLTSFEIVLHHAYPAGWGGFQIASTPALATSSSPSMSAMLCYDSSRLSSPQHLFAFFSAA
jgi:hypothetical protein